MREIRSKLKVWRKDSGVQPMSEEAFREAILEEIQEYTDADSAHDTVDAVSDVIVLTLIEQE